MNREVREPSFLFKLKKQLQCLQRPYFSSIFAFIYVALIAFCYWSWRRRIPFSAVLLETVTQIIMRFPGALGASVIALIIHAVWVIIWAVMSAGAVFLFYNFFEGTSTGNTAAGLVGAFLTFSFGKNTA